MPDSESKMLLAPWDLQNPPQMRQLTLGIMSPPLLLRAGGRGWLPVAPFHAEVEAVTGEGNASLGDEHCALGTCSSQWEKEPQERSSSQWRCSSLRG